MAVTKRHYFLAFCFLLFSIGTQAAILPEERADTLYHLYDGGGVEIDGPSILVRKNFAEKVSVSGNYYVDMVSSASVDVLSYASPYSEERNEYSLGFDYLNDRTIMSLSYTNSTESDYIADTIGYTVSQEFFGDLSTVTMGFSLGDDTVKARGADDFEASVKRRRFSLGLSQILSRRFIASLSYEAVFDEGFLRNPYRLARGFDSDNSTKRDNFFDGNTGTNGETLCADQNNRDIGGECYPETRNSEALAIRGIYAITNNASLRAEYRQYSDSWDVESQNFELRYTHQWGPKWLFELRTRAYQQTSGAFFYSDIIDLNSTIPEFYGRDKELAEYSSLQYGFTVTYTFKSRNAFFNNSTLNFSYDHMIFDYDNFRDATNENFAAGEEPLYSLEADVFRIYFSAYF